MELQKVVDQANGVLTAIDQGIAWAQAQGKSHSASQLQACRKQIESHAVLAVGVLDALSPAVAVPPAAEAAPMAPAEIVT